MDISNYTHRLLKLDQVRLVFQDVQSWLQNQFYLFFCQGAFPLQEISHEFPVWQFSNFEWPNLIISQTSVYKNRTVFVGEHSVVFLVWEEGHLITTNHLFLVFVKVSHSWVAHETFRYFVTVLVKVLHRVWRRLESFTHFFYHRWTIFLMKKYDDSLIIIKL